MRALRFILSLFALEEAETFTEPPRCSLQIWSSDEL